MLPRNSRGFLFQETIGDRRGLGSSITHPSFAANTQEPDELRSLITEMGINWNRGPGAIVARVDSSVFRAGNRKITREEFDDTRAQGGCLGLRSR